MTIDVFKIPEGEMEIMRILWEEARPMTIAELSLALRERFQRRIKPSTIHTQAGRLVKKGMAVLVQIDGYNVYLPLCPMAKYLAAAAQRFLRVLCDGSVAEMVSALMRAGSVSREDWAALKEMAEVALDELREDLREDLLDAEGEKPGDCPACPAVQADWGFAVAGMDTRLPADAGAPENVRKKRRRSAAVPRAA